MVMAALTTWATPVIRGPIRRPRDAPRRGARASGRARSQGRRTARRSRWLVPRMRPSRRTASNAAEWAAKACSTSVRGGGCVRARSAAPLERRKRSTAGAIFCIGGVNRAWTGFGSSQPTARPRMTMSCRSRNSVRRQRTGVGSGGEARGAFMLGFGAGGVQAEVRKVAISALIWRMSGRLAAAMVLQQSA